jgi:hypothetical protein
MTDFFVQKHLIDLTTRAKTQGAKSLERKLIYKTLRIQLNLSSIHTQRNVVRISSLRAIIHSKNNNKLTQ